jgi:hypothetical protein
MRRNGRAFTPLSFEKHGGYSLVVEPRFVEPVVRVRFPVAAQISQAGSESFRPVAVWSGYRESKDGGREADRLTRRSWPSQGRKCL